MGEEAVLKRAGGESLDSLAIEQCPLCSPYEY